MSNTADNSQKAILVNVSSSLATKFLKITLLVWVNQFLLKRIAPEEYSLLPLVMSLLIFADIFRNLFVDGIGRYIVEADAKNDKLGVQTIVSSMWPILLLVSACFAGLGSLTIVFIDSLLAIEAGYVAQARIMLGLLVCIFCLEVLLAPFTVGLYVKSKFTHINALTLFTELIRITIVICLLFGLGPRVMWLVIGSFSAQILNLLVQVFYTRKLLPDVKIVKEYFSLAKAKQLISFGAWSSVGNLSQFSINTVPFLLLGHFGSAVQVSIFHLGRLPELNLRNLALAGVQPIQPMLTARFSTDGQDTINELYYRGGRYHLWATLLFVAPLVVFSKIVATKYAGEGYSQAGLVMLILFASYPIIWASAMFYRISHAIGEVSSFFKCEIVDAILKIAAVSLLVIVFKMGAVGAALGISIATILVHIFTIWPQGLKMVSGNWHRFFKETIIPGCLPFLSAVMLCLLCKLFFHTYSWYLLGGIMGASVLGYLSILYLYCTDDFDKSLVQKIVEKAKLTLKRILDRKFKKSSSPV